MVGTVWGCKDALEDRDGSDRAFFRVVKVVMATGAGCFFGAVGGPLSPMIFVVWCFTKKGRCDSSGN
jgi:hypothetical protein